MQNQSFANWTRVELDFIFAPAQAYQQVNLALYQDDDNYLEQVRLEVEKWQRLVGERAMKFD